MAHKRRPISGVLLLDKPAGLSSNTALGRVKWLYNADKAGHTGTLDPFATGLLPICFGEAAKFARFMLEAQKGYGATLRLGEQTSTGDTEGEVIDTRAVNIGSADIEAALKKLHGQQWQMPPMHSALKRNGVPLYKLARQGIEVERQPRPIEIFSLQLVSCVLPEVVIDTVVSKGTYIRVLAEDIGRLLGCGAHLTALRRQKTGSFMLDQAITLDALEAMTLSQRDQQLLPADTLCAALPRLDLDSVETLALQHGRTIEKNALAEAEYRLYGDTGRFLGIGEITVTPNQGGRLTPVRLMAPTLESD
ncbi:MAG: tRNA pseudouridine(55) synthase TruB [Betaproteobacteria bacterium]|nr:tRNA pseudouridine(55) synthase TruB [Betaproteobacteria bacterium]